LNRPFGHSQWCSQGQFDIEDVFHILQSNYGFMKNQRSGCCDSPENTFIFRALPQLDEWHEVCIVLAGQEWIRPLRVKKDKEGKINKEQGNG
jgi:hypothetical protein